MSVLTGIICSLRWYISSRLCLMQLISVCYCVYRILMIYGVCYVWRKQLYVKGVRPRPLTCGKGGELKRIKHELRVFDPGRLLMVRVGNLNELSTS